ncbi:hypothetical protein J2800_002200 [Caulobacter rhizosphaerae]|jgi:hypothetical protein|uniref:Uncharacterized protein n=1 Tax=Caulobacter rhizosphaerae TaxID=2010972 RepID=A0ABU1MZ37_9CAUL|nr:hypothetical protein [Caulobacter rhizosphaerae]MDR6531453.1 hypothetical protein [Caulobacter rhizosphaerae]
MTGTAKRLWNAVSAFSMLIFLVTLLIQIGVYWGKLPVSWNSDLNTAVKFLAFGVFGLSRVVDMLAQRLIDAHGFRRAALIMGVIGVFFVSMITIGLVIG